MHTSLRLVAGVFGFLGMAAVAQAAPPDHWISTKVKLSLLTGDDVSSTAVHVDTNNGQVTLHGKVSSAAEKARAESIARGVDGVREVRDLLQVVRAREEKPVAMSDSRIEKSVSKVLKEEPSLKSGIAVKSVDKGIVLLAGKTDSMGDYLLAVECAHAVPGVRRVFSEIQGPAGTLEWKERSGSAHSDGYLTAATKLRLIGDSKVPALDVSVDTDHGVVTLFGSVPSQAVRAAAELDAHKVDGVVHVQNELEVVPKAEKETVKADDNAVRSTVEADFKAHAVEHVNVAVENGTVRLTGTVPTIWEQLKAATLARSATGVRAVNDDLRVSQ